MTLFLRNKIQAIFKNPFADLDAARKAPLHIDRALVSAIPDQQHGWLVAICLYLFMSAYAVGPGVCVWLALSELMPTRNSVEWHEHCAGVEPDSVNDARCHFPAHSSASMAMPGLFFVFAGFTVIYLITAAFFLPETKGKTLEEIEAHFEGVRAALAHYFDFTSSSTIGAMTLSSTPCGLLAESRKVMSFAFSVDERDVASSADRPIAAVSTKAGRDRWQVRHQG